MRTGAYAHSRDASRDIEAFRAARTEAPPSIDDVLDDSVWAEAPSFESFTAVEPVEGGRAKAAEVRIPSVDLAMSTPHNSAAT